MFTPPTDVGRAATRTAHCGGAEMTGYQLKISSLEKFLIGNCKLELTKYRKKTSQGMLAWGWTGPRRQAKQGAAQTRLKERKPSLPLFPFGDRGLWFQDAKSGVLSIRDTRARWTSCSSLNLNLFQQVLPGIKPFPPSWFLFFKRIITHMHTRVCACCSTGVAVRGQWELVLSFHHAGSGESSSIPQTWHQVPFSATLSRWPEWLLSIDWLTLKLKSQICVHRVTF